MRLSFTLFAVTAMLVAAQAQVPSYVPTDDLVGWWPFNGNANDESGNGNDGVVNGATLTTDRNGMIEAAYSFNGVSDFIETTAQGPLGTTARTFSFWVRTDNIAHQTPIDYYGVDGGAFQPILNNPCPGLGVDAGTGVVTRGDETLLDASWHHCTLVFDPTVGTTISSVIMYIDGVEQASIACNALDANADVNTTSTGPVLFGKTTSNVRYVNGDLDDIGIWNRALTSTEVTGLYTGLGVGVTETTNGAAHLLVFPNPSAGRFVLEISLSGKIGMHVLDIAGRQVYTGSLPTNAGSGQHRVDLTGLSSGTYQLQVWNNSTVITERLIIE